MVIWLTPYPSTVHVVYGCPLLYYTSLHACMHHMCERDQLTDTPCRNFLGIVSPSFVTNAKGLRTFNLALAMFAAIDFETGI